MYIYVWVPVDPNTFTQEPAVDKYGKSCIRNIWRFNDDVVYTSLSRYDQGRITYRGRSVAKAVMCGSSSSDKSPRYAVFKETSHLKRILQEAGIKYVLTQEKILKVSEVPN